ncbi:MAG: apolipoprotein N-acyltransferase [Parvibaculum sp.]|uniref:apolipoprotein N-acyltransferase n=1 Tax=Parvibaculum sp. TaxID=2024848 RepID=UPI0025F3F95F|nr:apolipoprotein N-acyltransferase [Parvibaculum sp.]MCE9648174.1 apolipoprotein N-acyltransferase [Parvibaculum sp.]
MVLDRGAAALLDALRRLARDLGHLSGWRRWACAFLAGALSVLALPPIHFLPILFLSFPILVWLLDGVDGGGEPLTPRKAMRASAAIGWWFGFGYFLLGLYWIGFAFMVEADKFAVFMPFAVIALPAGLALFTAAATLIARLVWWRGYARIAALAVSWAVFEWLRGHILTGFPWNLIGESFTSSQGLMQWAALTGVYGLSLIVVLIAAAPASFDPREDEDGERHAMHMQNWLVLLGALAALGLLWIGGAARLGLAMPAPAIGPETTMLRLVQPNIAQTEKWKPESRLAILGEFLRMSAEPTSAAPKGLGRKSIVIWPESALAIFLAREPYVLSAISRILPQGALLVTGSVRGEPGPDSPPDHLQFFYNSLYAVNSDGRIVATYDKFHLVPFGEYLPYHRWLSRIGLHKLTKLQGSFDTGPGPVTLSLPGAPPVSPLICYEIIFPGEVVSSAERPGWIVNVTNDAWFGTSSGPYQHLSQARLRAVEQGLPVARAANTGISAVIDAYGRVVAEKPLNASGVVDAALPPALAPTPYARLGDWIFLAMLLAVGGAAFAFRRR